MDKIATLASALLVLGIVAVPTVASAQAKTCRMEQQCHWVNFKKICTYALIFSQSRAESHAAVEEV